MKLFLYCFREYDEKPYYDALAERTPGFSYGSSPLYPSPENAELCRGYDAVSTTVTPFDRPLLAALRGAGIRAILARSIGVDHIDLDAARELGLHVAHVSYPPESVADYAIMLMLMSLRRMRQTLERAAVQDYTLRGKIGRDLCESTVGIIGTGRISTAVIRHLYAFGCRLLAYDPHENASLRGLCTYTSLDALLRESDIVSLHIPATPETFHLIGDDAFRRMKRGSILINTARGTLVDTEALLRALDEGILSGAALDVMEHEAGLYYQNRVGEPLSNPLMDRLRAQPSIILTPHTAFYTERVVRSMAEQVVSCLSDLSQGRTNPLILF